MEVPSGALGRFKLNANVVLLVFSQVQFLALGILDKDQVAQVVGLQSEVEGGGSVDRGRRSTGNFAAVNGDVTAEVRAKVVLTLEVSNTLANGFDSSIHLSGPLKADKLLLHLQKSSFLVQFTGIIPGVDPLVFSAGNNQEIFHDLVVLLNFTVLSHFDFVRTFVFLEATDLLADDTTLAVVVSFEDVEVVDVVFVSDLAGTPVTNRSFFLLNELVARLEQSIAGLVDEGVDGVHAALALRRQGSVSQLNEAVEPGVSICLQRNEGISSVLEKSSSGLGGGFRAGRDGGSLVGSVIEF
mmetsp:Transcript_16854/g.23682  ORF Transcript_16854/g.23682 Transcript_16854/m.23682 type:complete len:298 (+) Transcript_16854:1065-1958(+)